MNLRSVTCSIFSTGIGIAGVVGEPDDLKDGKYLSCSIISSFAVDVTNDQNEGQSENLRGKGL